ncbi:hypothetical protein QC760_010145 [Botrytis cinerea]
MAPVQPNPFLLAADNSPDLLPLLRSNPALASAQDEHGYSLMHAAASYSHLDLLRALVTEFNVNVDLKDEDGETALFVVETLDCAKLLVENCMPILQSGVLRMGVMRGKESRQKVTIQKSRRGGLPASNGTDAIVAHPPLVPEGLSVNIGTMNPEEDVGEVIDPEFKRRIDELAARDDFQTPAGQEELRKLITEAITGEVGEGREVRQRTE